MTWIRSRLRDLRYALPGFAGTILPAPTAEAAARISMGLGRRGLAVTPGFFQAEHSTPAKILAANLSVAALLAARQEGQAYLSVKAPPMGFDAAIHRAIASAAGMPLLFDAHSPRDADPTHDLVRAMQADFPATGLAIPGRWRRSAGDADSFRDTPARIRLVKGEWADPDWPEGNIEESYASLAERLAGRAAPVAVATHDPELARRALAVLVSAGTPCELEQLRGLPRRRTLAVAREFGVPVRVYVPFGPGWWPYAIDKALARPYLPVWWLRDTFGPAGQPAMPARAVKAAS